MCRDLAERSLIDILPRGLAKRPLKEICAERALIQILYTDLARTSLLEILCKDLVKGAEVLRGNHLWMALHRDLAQQLVQRTFQGDLAHDLLQRSSQRELAESYLVFLFITRVLLVLLACNHSCF